MGMIEKVAMAICEQLGDDWDREGEPLTSYLDMARAALEALREPSEAMVIAGIIERHGSETPEAWKLATANVYRAMIEAALNEGD